ncbi:hypothetical protein ACIBZJ_42545, partial [Cryptosporangium sp. NPDC051539]
GQPLSGGQASPYGQRSPAPQAHGQQPQGPQAYGQPSVEGLSSGQAQAAGSSFGQAGVGQAGVGLAGYGQASGPRASYGESPAAGQQHGGQLPLYGQAPAQQPSATAPFGQQQSAAPQAFGQPPSGQPPYGQPPAAQPPAGPLSYGQPPAGQPAYRQPPAGPPAYGQPPAGPLAYGQAPAGQQWPADQPSSGQQGAQPGRGQAAGESGGGAAGTKTWLPADETERVRGAATGMGALRLARREPGPAREFVGGLVYAGASLGALIVLALILSPLGDHWWVQAFRFLLIALIAGVFIGVIRAIRALVRGRMAIYLYDQGVVGTKRGGLRAIGWDRMSQVVVFTTEGVHLVADDNPMLVPQAVVGEDADREQFLDTLLPPLQHRGVEILRF